MAEAAPTSSFAKPALAGDEVAALSRALGETTGLAGARAAALRAYLSAAPPDRVRHIWRYTDPEWLLPEGPLIAGRVAAAGEPLEPPREGCLMVLAQGRRVASAASPRALAAGLRAGPLGGEEAGWLGAAVRPDHGLLEALNGAAWSVGGAVVVPEGVAIDGAIEVVVHAGGGGFFAPRLLVVLGAGAEATVVETHVGGGAGSRASAVTELVVGPGARLSYGLVQSWSRELAGHLTERAVLGGGASLATGLASLGGGRVKMDLGAILGGDGARSELAGVAIAGGRQHLDHHTEHRHEASRTWSNIDLKVALEGRSRSAYTGLIRIEPGATESEAYQEERNLLLSPRARADSIPELEILNNEVKCTHGATSSRLDREHLFYLRSRGLTEAAARALAVRGFLASALGRLPSELGQRLAARVDERLAALEGGRP